jgi:hypothetical protein
VEDGADRNLLSREEWAPSGSPSRSDGVASPGEETLGQPLQQGGKRRSRPLPTKAIDEDVDECGSEQSNAKEISQIWVRAFNVWLTDR